MGKRFWQSRVFRVWFSYYILIMMLPAIFCTAFYAYTIDMLEEKAYESGKMVIRQVGDVVDAQLQTIFNIGDAVYLSSNIGKIKYLSLPYTAEKYYELHERAKYLENFSAYTDIVKYTYVYHSDMHCLMDAGRIYTELNQIDTIIPERIGLSISDFKTLVAQTHLNDYYVLGDGQTIVYLRSIATKQDKESPIVTLCVVLNTDSIKRLIADTAQNAKGSVYMLMPDGQCFGTYAHSDPVDYPYLSEQRAVSERIAYDDKVVNYVDSAVSKFRYTLSVPRDSFLSDVNRTQLIFLSCLVVVLVLGTLIAYIFATRNYKPVHMLKQLARIPEKGEDDFSDLGGKLSALLESEDKMRDEIVQLNQIADVQLFYMLLCGDTSNLKRRQMAQFEALFASDVFVVMVIKPDEAEGDNSENYMPDIQNVVVLTNTLVYDLCIDTRGHVIRKDGETITAIFGFSNQINLSSTQFAVQEIAHTLVSRLWHHLGISVCAYVGDAQTGLEHIHDSYLNAKKAREYTEFIAQWEKRVILYDETMFSTNISWVDFDIVDAERRFINLMLEGSYEAAEQMLHTVLTYYSYKDGMSLYLVRTRMFGVMNMMLNVLHEVEPDLDAAFYEEMRPIEKLLAVNTIKELEETLFQVIDYLIGKKESEKTIDMDDKLSKIQTYVSNHYYKSDLSVQQIADEFDLSLPYLSRLFKREKGVGLLDYINRYRIEKAKELLKTDAMMTNAEIANQVGYQSSQTFIRIFKRYEGDTPRHFHKTRNLD